MARSNAANGGSNFFDLVIQVVATSDASYTLRAVVYLTSLNVIDSSNNLSIGGSWARSGTLALNGVYSAQPVWFQDIVVNRAYGANTPVSLSTSWSGVEYWGVTLAAAESYTVPARPWQLPAAPTSVAVARNGDTSHTVTWVRNTTGEAPYESQRVYRSTDGGGWALLATIAGTAASYTDTTTAADHDYRYLVHAVNSSGYTSSAATASIQTTPAAPTGATAAKTGAGDIQVSWTNASILTPITWRIEQSTDGGTSWSPLVSGVAQGTTSYVHASPNPAVTHRYRVRAESTEGASTQSAWALTGVVQLLAAPAAPTGLGPSAIRDATDDVTFIWTHVPVDTTPQTKFELRHRTTGGIWTTVGPVTSSLSEWTLPGSTYANPLTVEWQVRTWGQHADPSPWSATASTPTSTRPTAAISTPEDASTLDGSFLLVQWVYYDADGQTQAAWTVELLDGANAVVETNSGAGTDTTAALTTRLPDDTSWSVRVRVQDASGLWSEPALAVFDVDYALPPAPLVVLEWDPVDATVTVQVTNPDPDDEQVATDHVYVYRAIDAGPFELVAAGVPPNTTITDLAPTVAGTNTYRVIAVSALPSTTSVDLQVEATGAEALFLSAAPEGTPPGVPLSAYSVVCRAGLNKALSVRPGRVRVLRRYEGITYPILHAGAARSTTLTAEADLTPLATDLCSTPEQWEALAGLPGPFLWRDPSGRRILVVVPEDGIELQGAIGTRTTHLRISATRAWS